MSEAVVWFLTLEGLGVIALPWIYAVFRFLPDRGLSLAKPLALLVLAYLVWLLGLTHILPNTQLTIWVVFAGIGVGSAWLAGRKWEELRDFLRAHWPALAAGEVAFLLMFVAWALVVSGSPGISHTEKPMDFMLLNASHQARYFPAEDSWLSGHSISYYYFGHIIMATLAKMSDVGTSVGYNLAITTLPALAGAAAFGLVYNLVRLSGGATRWALGAGAAAPMLVLLSGNLGGALEFVRLRGWAGTGFWDWAGIDGLTAAATSGGVFPSEFWWWFKSTRVIGTSEGGTTLDYTITEFPAFSFLLGDLHAHVLAIPFFLLAIAASLNIYCSPGVLGLAWLRRHWPQATLAALCGGALAFINFWDFPTTMALLAGALLLKAYRDCPTSMAQSIAAALSTFVPLFVLAVAMFAPVYFTFSGQTSGVLPLTEVATRPFHLFLVIGPFLLLSLAFLPRLLAGVGRLSQANSPAAVLALLVVGVPIGVWIASAFLFVLVADGSQAAFDDLGRRLLLAGPGALVVGAAVFVATTLARQGRESAAAFVAVMIALGLYLIMNAELYHIVDSFGGAWRRMNTVFKFYYQAWLLLGIASSFALYALWPHGSEEPAARRGREVLLRTARYAGATALGVLLAASFYYTLGATLDRGGAYAEPLEGRTLDGLAYLRTADPGEYSAIAWLRDEAIAGTIVEAVGDDYSDHANISSSTGLPTVLGWKGHELQWRGSAEAFAGREQDVATIYSGQNPATARQLLEKYGVRYVYLGSRERKQYGVTSLSELDAFLKTAFEQDGVLVYEFIDQPVP